METVVAITIASTLRSSSSASKRVVCGDSRIPRPIFKCFRPLVADVDHFGFGKLVEITDEVRAPVAETDDRRSLDPRRPSCGRRSLTD